MTLSECRGHPEYHWTSGIETTIGPLEQGVATSVGMSIAQQWLPHHFNRLGFELFNDNVYAVCGDRSPVGSVVSGIICAAIGGAQSDVLKIPPIKTHAVKRDRCMSSPLARSLKPRLEHQQHKTNELT